MILSWAQAFSVRVAMTLEEASPWLARPVWRAAQAIAWVREEIARRA